jgi:hypothetical protein
MSPLHATIFAAPFYYHLRQASRKADEIIEIRRGVPARKTAESLLEGFTLTG